MKLLFNLKHGEVINQEPIHYLMVTLYKYYMYITPLPYAHAFGTFLAVEHGGTESLRS